MENRVTRDLVDNQPHARHELSWDEQDLSQ